MRFKFVRGTKEQRAAVHRRFQDLMLPEVALALIRRNVASDAPPVRALCSAARNPKDRFVLRVDTESANGVRAVYALKGYAENERAGQIGNTYQALSQYWARRGEHCPAILPLDYIREEALFILPWVHGMSLADAICAGRPDILQHALAQVPRTLARFHTDRIMPEAPTNADTMVQLTLTKWERHYRRFPEARQVVQPLTNMLQAALVHLEPSIPELAHGDAAPSNFLWDGERWLLLDLDTFGYVDPAYDAGYLLARLEQQLLGQSLFEPRAAQLLAAMRSACLDAMPGLSSRNVAFFYGMTLIYKSLPLLFKSLQPHARQQPREVAAALATRVSAALQGVITGEANL